MKKIYRIAIISTEREKFFRELEVFHNHTFLDLHKAIQTACDYDQSQLASFFILNTNFEKTMELTAAPMYEQTALYPTQWMGEYKLYELLNKPMQNLIYQFDLFSERSFIIFLKKISPAHSTDIVPRILRSQGVPPRQIYRGESHIDNLLNAFSEN
ncbi:MAG: hypothetical protein C0599_00640 [Salinivirgaceae bacterium]|nr:MAG: hypothetical protein C0599_00640 [Salinivirgaceae bacterium]